MQYPAGGTTGTVSYGQASYAQPGQPQFQQQQQVPLLSGYAQAAYSPYPTSSTIPAGMCSLPVVATNRSIRVCCARLARFLYGIRMTCVSEWCFCGLPTGTSFGDKNEVIKRPIQKESEMKRDGAL